MTAKAWVAFYPADYVADTGHLTLAQHGAYLLLMMHSYATGRPIPVDAVYRICRCLKHDDKRAVDAVLREFFAKDGNVFRHHRIETELLKRSQIAEKYESRAKKAAAARWKHNASSIPQAMHGAWYSQPQSQIEQNLDSAADASRSVPDSETPNQTRRTKARPVGTRIPEDFVPDDSDYRLAVEVGEKHGIVIDVADECERFLDHFRSSSGKNGVKRDWRATFRNWLRRSPEFRGGQKHAPKSDRQLDTRLALLRGFGFDVAAAAGFSGGDLRSQAHRGGKPVLEAIDLQRDAGGHD